MPGKNGSNGVSRNGRVDQAKAIGPWEPSAEQLTMYMDYIRGDMSQSEVAEKHGIKQPSVSAMVKKINNWLLKQNLDQIREMKVEHTERHMHQYTEAMKAWYDSKGVVEVHTTGMSAGGPINTTKTSYCNGDSKYLALAAKLLDDIRKINGANAPLVMQHEGDIRAAGKTEEEYRAALLERLEALMARARGAVERPSAN